MALSAADVRTCPGHAGHFANVAKAGHPGLVSIVKKRGA